MPVRSMLMTACAFCLGMFQDLSADGAVRDLRQEVAASSFTSTEGGVWQTPWEEVARPFDELIYSWQIALPEGQGARYALQVRFEDGSESEWLYAGYWGEVQDSVTERKIPTFEDGKLDYDQLMLKKPATGFRYQAVSAGVVPLSVMPGLHVVTTDNRVEDSGAGRPTLPIPDVMDFPLRKQVSSAGERMKDRCQSAAVATAMQFYGTALKLEDIVALTNDPEYNLAGIWPRTLGAATQQGFSGYIDRFRTWDDVVQTLTENKAILCSIRMGEKGDYIDPPYRSIGGHIVVLAGLSQDGETVYIVDSALAEAEEGYLVPWHRTDFEKVWMVAKGGVGMVLEPPAGESVKYAEKLPRLLPRRMYYRDARSLLRSNAKLARLYAPKLIEGVEAMSPEDRKLAEEEYKEALEDADAAEKLADEMTGFLMESWEDPIQVK